MKHKKTVKNYSVRYLKSIRILSNIKKIVTPYLIVPIMSITLILGCDILNSEQKSEPEIAIPVIIPDTTNIDTISLWSYGGDTIRYRVKPISSGNDSFAYGFYQLPEGSYVQRPVNNINAWSSKGIAEDTIMIVAPCMNLNVKVTKYDLTKKQPSKTIVILKVHIYTEKLSNFISLKKGNVWDYRIESRAKGKSIKNISLVNLDSKKAIFFIKDSTYLMSFTDIPDPVITYYDTCTLGNSTNINVGGVQITISSGCLALLDTFTCNNKSYTSYKKEFTGYPFIFRKTFI